MDVCTSVVCVYTSVEKSMYVHMPQTFGTYTRIPIDMSRAQIDTLLEVMTLGTPINLKNRHGLCNPGRRFALP